MKKIKICKFKDCYLEELRQINYLLYYKLQYQEEYVAGGCNFAINEKKEVVGAGCVSDHGETSEISGIEIKNWHFNMTVKMTVEDPFFVKKLLLKSCVDLLKKKKTGKKRPGFDKRKADSLHVFVNEENLEELDFYYVQGFVKESTTQVFSFDLSKELTTYEILQDLQIKKLDVCGDNAEEYRIATAISGDGILNNMTEDWFADEKETFSMYGIMNGDKLIANLTTWDMPVGRSVIENVYTLPEHRGKHMASELLAFTLSMLKDKGRNEVLISSDIKNENAIKIYQNIGFEWKYSIFELAYHIV